jgi:hypothetical protein
VNVGSRYSKAEIVLAVKAVETALKAGHFPPGAPTRNNNLGCIRAASVSTGLDIVTIRRRLDYGKRFFNLEPRWALYKEPSKPAAAPKIKEDQEPKEPIDKRRMTALQDEVSELKRQLKEAHRASLDDDAIRQILGGVAEAPSDPPKWVINVEKSGKGAHVPMTIWSDWHAGEVVSRYETNGVNEFNSVIFERRVRTLVEKTIHLCREYGPGNYPGIVVNILGDLVSGGLHPELLKTDDDEVIPAALRVRDMLVWAIRALADEFRNVFVPCVSGNHGRATHKPEFKRYVFKNFDWLVYQLLIREFANDSRVTFMVRDSNEADYSVFGLNFLAVHGDMLGVKGGDGIIGLLGPVSRGEFKVGRQLSSIGRPYDVLLMGHWHTPLWLPRVIAAGTLKGFDEYAKNALRATPTPPSQPLWFVTKQWGVVSRMEVYVDKPTLDSGAEWVAIRKEDAA